MTRAEQIQIEKKRTNELYERCYFKNIVSFDSLPEEVKIKILRKEKKKKEIKPIIQNSLSLLVVLILSVTTLNPP